MNMLVLVFFNVEIVNTLNAKDNMFNQIDNFDNFFKYLQPEKFVLIMFD